MSRILLNNESPVKSHATYSATYSHLMSSKLRKVLAENLTSVMKARRLSEGRLAEMTRGEVSQKTINNLKNAKQSATLDTLEELARALRIDVALLLQPGLAEDQASNQSITDLFRNFTCASEEGQVAISRIAEREAQYACAQKSPHK